MERGEIYYITFPYTFDSRYLKGKSKFVLILQEGDYFKKYDTVEILLITSEKQYKPRSEYVTDVPIEVGTTRLNEKSWICCAQPYPVRKSLFEEPGVWCAGKLTPKKMDEVDEALYYGLCMGLQNELFEEDEENEQLNYMSEIKRLIQESMREKGITPEEARKSLEIKRYEKK